MQVNLVIPGPEQPLVDGIEAVFRKGMLSLFSQSNRTLTHTEHTHDIVGIPCFGPSAKAAAMEGSKTFSKEFMSRHGIPTAAYQNFSDYPAALAYVESINHDIVIKASGLAAGKGVLIPTTKAEAIQGLKDIMVAKEFGSAGEQVVIEEFMTGQELSILAFSDGYTVLALPAAQDHKRIGDGDTGLNTGGMGAYSPAPCAGKEMEDEIMRTIVQPTIDGMRKEGTAEFLSSLRISFVAQNTRLLKRSGIPFVGILFTGVMLTPSGPKCLEYNVRFGDPETEALLPLLSAETDLAEIFLVRWIGYQGDRSHADLSFNIQACVEHRLDSIKLVMKEEFAATVVLASKGYPGDYVKGIEITIGALPSSECIPSIVAIRINAIKIAAFLFIISDVNVFHAGTIIKDGKLVTAGGRVLAVTATAPTLKDAVKLAYEGVGRVHFDGMVYRKDIAYRFALSLSFPFRFSF